MHRHAKPADLLRQHQRHGHSGTALARVRVDDRRDVDRPHARVHAGMGAQIHLSDRRANAGEQVVEPGAHGHHGPVVVDI